MQQKDNRSYLIAPIFIFKKVKYLVFIINKK